MTLPNALTGIGVLRIHHVAVAVPSIEAAAPFYGEGLGLAVSAPEIVASQKVRVVFVQVGESRVELLEPTSEDSPIAKALAKRGTGLHHICYEVEDIDEALRLLKERGIRLIDEQPREGAHGTRIAFLHPKATGGVLTEIASRVRTA